MIKGSPPLNNQNRYHLRDIESGAVKFKFRICGGAFMYKESMRHSLGDYYEVYDSEKKCIVSDAKTQHVYKKRRLKEKISKKRSLIENMNKIGKSRS